MISEPISSARDAVIAAARDLERARSAPAETFDMRNFWYAVQGVSKAVHALDKEDAING